MEIQLEEAHQVCKKLIDQIFKKVTTYQSESDIKNILISEQKIIGYKQNWHRPTVRIGKNTICAFDDRSLDNLALKELDLLFIDIGLVVGEHESDYGETRIINNNQVDSHIAQRYQQICKDSKIIWQKARDQWKNANITGQEIYQFSKEEAQNRGWTLDFIEGGHRIGRFPHTRTPPERLCDLSSSPVPYEWILEIKLLSPCRQYGAFYEEILR